MSTKDVNPENCTEPDQTAPELTFADEHATARDVLEVGVFANRDRGGVTFEPKRWLPMPHVSGYPGIYGPRINLDSDERCPADDVDWTPFVRVLEARVSNNVRDGSHIASMWLDRETGEVIDTRGADGRDAPDMSDDVLHEAVAAVHSDVDLQAGDDDREFVTDDQLAAATATLQSVNVGDEVLVNDRNRALTVTETGDDELQLEGNGTTYRVELDAEYVPKHHLWEKRASWLHVSSADRPTIITTVEIEEGDD